jgi:hypothetical protein
MLIRISLAFALTLGLVSGQAGNQNFIPFSRFLDGVKSATYAQYAATRVRNESVFHDMQRHILRMYSGVRNPADVTSFIPGDRYIDCIPFMEQPSVHLMNLTREQAVPFNIDELRANLTREARNSSLKESEVIVSLRRDPNSKDHFGNLMRCAEGTVGQSRLTLELMTAYPTLAEFFDRGKGIGVNSYNSTSRRSNKERRQSGVLEDGYRHVWQSRRERGSGRRRFGGSRAKLNVWSPQGGYSISQIWVAVESPLWQTVEAGWTVDAHRGRSPRFFSFYTSNGYKEGSTCANDECGTFIHPSGGRVGLDTVLSSSSISGGTQFIIDVEYVLGFGAWILVVWDGDSADIVGWYLASLFDNAGGTLGEGATSVDFGGEVAESEIGSQVYGQMGSGQFAESSLELNFGRVAYQRSIMVRRLGASVFADGAGRAMPDGSAARCYNQWNDDVHPVWGRYFFFGGPGGRECDRDIPCGSRGCPVYCEEGCPDNRNCGQDDPQLAPECCFISTDPGCIRKRDDCIRIGCQ